MEQMKFMKKMRNWSMKCEWLMQKSQKCKVWVLGPWQLLKDSLLKKIEFIKDLEISFMLITCILNSLFVCITVWWRRGLEQYVLTTETKSL